MRLMAVAGLIVALMSGGLHNEDGDPPPAMPRADPLSWGPCETESNATGFECATLDVPLDYAKPDGSKIGLALIRVRATDKAHRIGSLLFNFGGPGGSGVSTLLEAAQAFGTLRMRYDLISFDPRGVERSDGVVCLSPGAFEKWTQAEPSDQASTERRLVTEFAEGCVRMSGRVLPFIGTVNAAHDMDRIRAAVGDKHLNYFGFSYGTHLGAVYATQYPKRVGRMVLDGAVDPTVSSLEQSRTQLLGFQHAYEDYLDDCVQQGCPFGADMKAANATILGLLNDLAKKPLTVGGRIVNEDIGRSGIVQALYSKLSWPLLTDAISSALKGDGAALLDLADQYYGRNSDGTYTTLQSSIVAISCVDTTDRPSIEAGEALARDLAAKAPIFAPDAASAGTCSAWPIPGNDKSQHIDATGSNPIVVIGNTGDPATPYQWAPALAEKLRTAVLITLKGEGHGAYGQSTCVDNAVNAYFLTGQVPPHGLTCTPGV